MLYQGLTSTEGAHPLGHHLIRQIRSHYWFSPGPLLHLTTAKLDLPNKVTLEADFKTKNSKCSNREPERTLAGVKQDSDCAGHLPVCP